MKMCIKVDLDKHTLMIYIFEAQQCVRLQIFKAQQISYLDLKLVIFAIFHEVFDSVQKYAKIC